MCFKLSYSIFARDLQNTQTQSLFWVDMYYYNSNCNKKKLLRNYSITYFSNYRSMLESTTQPIVKLSSPKKSSLSHSNSTSSSSSATTTVSATSSNKMINLFTNLINRSNHKSSSPQNPAHGSSLNCSLDMPAESHVTLNHSFSQIW